MASKLVKTIHSAEQRALIAVLRLFRDEAKLRQDDVAKKLGKPQSFVSKFESGERRLDILELRTVCRALGITLVDFVNQLEKEIDRTSKKKSGAGQP